MQSPFTPAAHILWDAIPQHFQEQVLHNVWCPHCGDMTTMADLGIRLRRDNWVSVRYAEELNSITSSVILQRADRHGILGEKPPDFQVSL